MPLISDEGSELDLSFTLTELPPPQPATAFSTACGVSQRYPAPTTETVTAAFVPKPGGKISVFNDDAWEPYDVEQFIPNATMTYTWSAYPEKSMFLTDSNHDDWKVFAIDDAARETEGITSTTTSVVDDAKIHLLLHPATHKSAKLDNIHLALGLDSKAVGVRNIGPCTQWGELTTRTVCAKGTVTITNHGTSVTAPISASVGHFPVCFPDNTSPFRGQAIVSAQPAEEGADTNSWIMYFPTEDLP